MAKARALEDTLAALHRLHDDPTSPASITELRQALANKSPHVAAKAAQIAGAGEVSALTSDLAAAFNRFMINPVKADPNCAAKLAIADALYRIGAYEEDVFLRGIRHVQLEPVWGGRADTAGGLRSVCGLGLVRMNYRDTMAELADLLADPDVRVRVDAARAIAYSENDQGAPLLRLKILSGDEPEVIAECLSALLKLTPDAAVPFVGRFLDADDAFKQESAALALGGSRLLGAFGVLRAWWERTADPGRRRTALLAIAMLKHDEPLDFLLSLIAESEGPTARDAIAALGLYRHDDALVERVRQTAAGRDDVDLRKAIAETFEGISRG